MNDISELRHVFLAREQSLRRQLPERVSSKPISLLGLQAAEEATPESAGDTTRKVDAESDIRAATAADGELVEKGFFLWHEASTYLLLFVLRSLRLYVPCT